MNDQVYTPIEVAELMKVSRATVHEWIREGRIQAIRIGRVVRIPAAEVAKLLGREVELKQMSGSTLAAS